MVIRCKKTDCNIKHTIYNKYYTKNYQNQSTELRFGMNIDRNMETDWIAVKATPTVTYITYQS